ncbi:MAG: 6-phosphofructokinase [Bacteroidetes bacterium RIFOXYA12_FULL_35_11]|nr:MAG: 6-phosphofructokinase [Bacteroidetes bacterium GWF2_35_48]OFY74046.1 MAG: 6-phosphofructokinase [Bacteroidetes bacterium RIFOXYA12_FULL_35_11]OFY95576.1 MAG: 6-phosphofructokinase [Bacteroidetes bacterium RIFOXYC12_FULL_35_7]OFY97751.1 MAG: 6-phosphofructokinase [Bacteroidetes bacterium RIFOXYB2_FULL_35_7]HBX53016.1 6-phosphofructokinase [Bacteroidales bacterium]
MIKQKTVVILCAGGPAPGINTVIATVSKRFISGGYRILGLNYGYKTIFMSNPDFIEINYDLADRIFDKGGSYLKMSRHKPKKEEFNVDFFVKENIVLLVTIGGDDTASSANRISQYLAENNHKIQNIHVPKTIDNDLPLPDNIPTFGYHTAKNEGVRICKTILEDARTSDGWFVISAMGREAGHLALGIGLACHYPMIIIPEMFYKVSVTFDRILKMIISSMVKRELMGLKYGAAIVSEGVFHYFDEEEIMNCGIVFTYDDHGHPELGNVSKAHIFNVLLQTELKNLNLKFRSRPEEVGYELRCVSPIAYDLKYCTNLGNGVKVLFDRGETQCIVVSTANDEVLPLYMKDISNEQGIIKPRLVNVQSERFLVTLGSFEYITERDYAAAKKYFANPEEYDLKNILKIEI